MRIGISHEMVAQFAVLVDDHNPAHTDPTFAEKVPGLTRPNVPGALLSTVVLAAIEDAGLEYQRVRFRFRKWYHVGDEHILIRSSPSRWSIASEDGSELVAVRIE